MAQTITNSNEQYYLHPSAITFELNYQSNPSRIAVSVISGTRILVAKSLVGYDAKLNTYRKWLLKGYNTYLNSSLATSKVYIYARLHRSDETDGLLLFSGNHYDIDGDIINDSDDASGSGSGSGSGSDTPTYYYIELGYLTAPTSSSRSLVFDTGCFNTDKERDERVDNTLFDYDSTTQVITPRHPFLSLIINTTLSVGTSLSLAGKAITAFVDTITEATKNATTSIPTIKAVTSWVAAKISELDDKYLRKDQSDTTEYSLTTGKLSVSATSKSGSDGSASIGGNTTVGGTLTVATNKATSLGGTLGVADAVTLNDTLSVTGNTSLGGTLTVATNKATSLGGTLSVDNTSTLKGNVVIGTDNTPANIGSPSFNQDIFTGYGWRIFSGANGFSGVFDSLTLRRFLEVPELRYNRCTVSSGIAWLAPGTGVIESVTSKDSISSIASESSTEPISTDDYDGVIKLKLEDGEYGSFADSDIVMGMFHYLSGYHTGEDVIGDVSKGIHESQFQLKGFTTVYFKVTHVLTATNIITPTSGSAITPTSDNAYITYKLRNSLDSEFTSAVHPCSAMTIVAYGNFDSTDHADRQNSLYATRKYWRYLKNVNTWNFESANIAMQFGEMSNFTIGGTSFSGYSGYLTNLYMEGLIKQIDPHHSGQYISTINYRGEWAQGTYYLNEQVLHNDSSGRPAMWLCIVSSTNLEPTESNSSAWTKVQAQGTNGTSYTIRGTGYEIPSSTRTPADGDYGWNATYLTMSKYVSTSTSSAWQTLTTMVQGDVYYITMNNAEVHVIYYNGSAWIDLGNIKGDKGDTGTSATFGKLNPSTLEFSADPTGKLSVDTQANTEYRIVQGASTVIPDKVYIAGTELNADYQTIATSLVAKINSTTGTLYIKAGANHAFDQVNIFSVQLTSNTLGNFYCNLSILFVREGSGIGTITQQWALGISSTTAPTTGWQDTYPAWTLGQYIWTRYKTTYTDGRADTYTGVQCLVSSIGLTGSLLRGRGTWNNTTAYHNDKDYQDWVLGSDNSPYLCVVGNSGVNPVGESPRVYWQAFNEMNPIATSVILANKGYIDVLGAGSLFVGAGTTKTSESVGWTMTNGAITHTSGLSLNADGELYCPDGFSMIVDDDENNLGDLIDGLYDGKFDVYQLSGTIATSVTWIAYNDSSISELPSLSWAASSLDEHIGDCLVFSNGMSFEFKKDTTKTSTYGSAYGWAATTDKYLYDAINNITTTQQAVNDITADGKITNAERNEIRKINESISKAYDELEEEYEELEDEGYVSGSLETLWNSYSAAADALVSSRTGYEGYFYKILNSSGTIELDSTTYPFTRYDLNTAISNYYLLEAQFRTALSDARLLPTGISVGDKKITITSDNFTIQNNSGERTLAVDEVGDVTLTGSLLNLDSVITADNFTRFFNDCRSDHIYHDAAPIDFNLPRVGNVIRLTDFPADIKSHLSSNPEQTNNFVIGLPSIYPYKNSSDVYSTPASVYVTKERVKGSSGYTWQDMTPTSVRSLIGRKFYFYNDSGYNISFLTNAYNRTTSNTWTIVTGVSSTQYRNSNGYMSTNVEQGHDGIFLSGSNTDKFFIDKDNMTEYPSSSSELTIPDGSMLIMEFMCEPRHFTPTAAPSGTVMEICYWRIYPTCTFADWGDSNE